MSFLWAGTGGRGLFKNIFEDPMVINVKWVNNQEMKIFLEIPLWQQLPLWASEVPSRVLQDADRLVKCASLTPESLSRSLTALLLALIGANCGPSALARKAQVIRVLFCLYSHRHFISPLFPLFRDSENNLSQLIFYYKDKALKKSRLGVAWRSCG